MTIGSQSLGCKAVRAAAVSDFGSTWLNLNKLDGLGRRAVGRSSSALVVSSMTRMFGEINGWKQRAG